MKMRALRIAAAVIYSILFGAAASTCVTFAAIAGAIGVNVFLKQMGASYRIFKTSEEEFIFAVFFVSWAIFFILKLVIELKQRKN